MKKNQHNHHRHSLRLKDYNYSTPGMYFITICTRDKTCIFGDIVNGKMLLNEYGGIVHKYWFELENKFNNIELPAFVVLPNHIHGIIHSHGYNCFVGAIHELPLQQRRRMLIPGIVGYFKMNTAKLINDKRKSPGEHVWQRNYYEHIIRNECELNEIREYIVNNPIKWELDNENPCRGNS